MKNIYKDFIKIMDKAQNLLVGKKYDRYYICDGFQAVYINEPTYRLYFMTEKPYYIELEEGQGYTLPKNKKQIIDNITNAIEIERVFKLDNPAPVEKTDFLQEISYHNKQTQVRIIKMYDAGQLMTVNNDWLNALENAGYVSWVGTENTKPIMSTYDGNMALILPIKCLNLIEDIAGLIDFENEKMQAA